MPGKNLTLACTMNLAGSDGKRSFLSLNDRSNLAI